MLGSDKSPFIAALNKAFSSSEPGKLAYKLFIIYSWGLAPNEELPENQEPNDENHDDEFWDYSFFYSSFFSIYFSTYSSLTY